MIVPVRFDETVQRLALGVEPIDAQRGQPMLSPVMLTHDDGPSTGGRHREFERHPSNRWSLRYGARDTAAASTVDLRLYDQPAPPYDSDSDRRRFVPRRIGLRLPALTEAEAAPPAARGCRLALWPGCAYPTSACVTGLRAHAMRAAAGPLALRPARWARVLATVPVDQPDLVQATVVGRAFCDDRGEFLLLIRFDAATLVAGPALPVRLRLFAAAEAVPPDAALPDSDALWDLPLETPASLDDADPVLRGEALPAGYAEVLARAIDLPLGRLLRGQPPLVI